MRCCWTRFDTKVVSLALPFLPPSQLWCSRKHLLAVVHTNLSHSPQHTLPVLEVAQPVYETCTL